MLKHCLLVSGLVAVVACGGDDDEKRPALTCDENRGTTLKVVASALQYPSSSAVLGADLDGDGRAENQFGEVNAALLLQGVNIGIEANAAVVAGAAPLLLSVLSSDASLTLDGCPVVTAATGAETATPPDFSATPTFTVDASSRSITLAQGKIGEDVDNELVTPGGESGVFDLNAYFTIGLQKISLVNTRISGTVGPDGIVNGQINGAVPASELQATFGIPLAIAIQAIFASPPPDASPLLPTVILSLFDEVGVPADGCPSSCRDPEAFGGQCATPKDGVIAICEVLTSETVTTRLRPDVHVLADDGVTLDIDASNPNKNAMSFGIGFTAVKASF